MCSLEKIQATCRGYLMRTLYNKRSVLTRHNIVNEIYETELHFVLHLNMVISLFKVPVEDSGGRILPRLVAQTIFSNVEQVMSAACVNANKFQTAVDVWKYDSKFGGVMLQVLNNMVPLTEYTLRWDSLKRELKNAYKNNLFKTFVKVQCAPETTDNLSFEDLLITPVQRLMRYKSLLSELLKNTPPEHPDYIDTMKAVAVYHYLLISTNTRAKQQDSLVQLGGMVYGMDELIQPWRYCTFYGECFVNTVQSFCFAFNDMITWTDSLVPILHNDNIIFYFRFVPENVIRKTDNCKFSPTQTNKSSVRVTSKDKHLIFIFPDKETMLKWVDVFNNCFN